MLLACFLYITYSFTKNEPDWTEAMPELCDGPCQPEKLNATVSSHIGDAENFSECARRKAAASALQWRNRRDKF